MTPGEIVGLFAWAGFAWGLILIPFAPEAGLGLALVSAAIIALRRPG